MVTKRPYDQWLRLRWRHYYEWKNLLNAEREARQFLEDEHQQQLINLSTSGERCQSGHIVRDQLARLIRLRQEQRQNRIQLNEHQALEVADFQEQTAQQINIRAFERFETLSALRRW